MRSGRRGVSISLAPALLALLAWNLAVYLPLALQRIAHERRSAARPRCCARWPARSFDGSHAAGAAVGSSSIGVTPSACARCRRASRRCCMQARLPSRAGALASMYLRGLAFEYRAGWDSTFLDARGGARSCCRSCSGRLRAERHRRCPTSTQLARPALRRVGGGENAARWIHLHADHAGAGRAAAARACSRCVGVARAAARARSLPLPLDDAYFRRLLRAQRGELLPVHVLPVQLSLPRRSCAPGLRAVLERASAPAATLARSSRVRARRRGRRCALLTVPRRRPRRSPRCSR